MKKKGFKQNKSQAEACGYLSQFNRSIGNSKNKILHIPRRAGLILLIPRFTGLILLIPRFTGLILSKIISQTIILAR